MNLRNRARRVQRALTGTQGRYECFLMMAETPDLAVLASAILLSDPERRYLESDNSLKDAFTDIVYRLFRRRCDVANVDGRSSLYQRSIVSMSRQKLLHRYERGLCFLTPSQEVSELAVELTASPPETLRWVHQSM